MYMIRRVICNSILLLLLTFTCAAQVAPGFVGVITVQSVTPSGIAHVASTFKQSTSFAGSVTTTTINATAANFVCVMFNTFTASTTFTDNGGHTWTHVSGALQASPTSAQYSDIFYCIGSFSSAFTVTTSNISYISVSAFSGVNTTSPIDVVGTGTGNTTSAISVTTSTVTPTASGDLLLTVGACGNVPAGFGAPTPSGSIITIGAVASSAGIAYSSGSGYQLLTGLTGISSTWTYGGVSGQGSAATILLVKKQ